MRKKWKQLVVAGLAVSMVVPFIAGAGMNAKAGRVVQEEVSAEQDPIYDYTANKVYEFNFKQLEMAQAWDTQISVDEDTGKATLTYSKAYDQIFFNLPEGIDPARVTKVELTGSNLSNICLKLQKGVGGAEVTDYSNAYSIPAGSDYTVIDIMYKEKTVTPVVVDSVKITLATAPAKKQEIVVTKKLSDLEIAANDEGAELENGTVTFNEAYQSIYFTIPATDSDDPLARIDVKGDAKGLSYKVMNEDHYTNNRNNDSAGGLTVTYGNASGSFEVTVTDPVVFVVMSGGGAPYGSFSLDSEIDFVYKKSIPVQMDIPNLKDTVVSANGLGEDAYVATCISGSTLNDPKAVQLVKKHFNAVTLENELKPESLFSEISGADATVEFKGQKVPSHLNFSTPDSILDTILEWNAEDENDDIDIKVRGHVLTWHSQTPDWFFKENYDAKGAYVSPEVMTIRHEWYIKSVMEHYFSDESPYKDLFYGFDVVNEACSDSTGTYRSAAEGSPWAAIYGIGSEKDAPDYILNAFRFANYYAHYYSHTDDLELYYNDYNDCSSGKIDAIAKLLQSVKNHEKDVELPTRISGFGMQGHHEIDFPTKKQVIDAATKYGKIVGKVQVTELDFKSSKNYDGSEAMQPAEYTKMAHRYKDVYQAYVEVDQIPGIDVNGFTVWGTHDAVSWLNTFNGAGGGADGRPQCALLFDRDYQAKPAFWGIVNPDRLDPFVNSIDVIQSNDGTYTNGTKYSFEKDDVAVDFVPVWDEDGVKFDVKANVADSMTFYYVGKTDEIEFQTVSGNEAEFTIANDDGFRVLDTVKFDIVVKAGDTVAYYNDTKGGQADSSEFYAEATLKPFATIQKGTPVIDAKNSGIWDDVAEIPLTIKGQNPKATATAKLLWDEDNLYLYMVVKDPVLDKTGGQDHTRDSVEVFIDEKNAKAGAYEDGNDKQYRIDYMNVPSFNHCEAANLRSWTDPEAEGGYIVEAAYKWTNINAAAGKNIGLDLQINDAENGDRIGWVNWFATSGNGYQDTTVFGTARLGNETVSGNDVDENDKVEGKAVEIKINSIGTVKYNATSKKKIDAARSAYDALEEYKQFYYVDKAVYKNLVAAEKTYAGFVAEEVADEIGTIGTVTYDEESKAKIDAAREAVDKLTELEKECIPDA
ncbi:MAG: endo-1,4-beta-xylanase, partial [Lachnospiraceae bacterium]|nr:endo-1,4-beta-xylanase [Lachnospiraceae bacterium]